LHQPPLVAVVEDESSVRKALGRLLRSDGLAAETYASGEEFLEALPAHAPDCLLLDLQLPGLNGLAVQSRLQQCGLTFPVIFITANDGSDARHRAMQGGAAAWLRKPVEDLQLLEVIRRSLGGKTSFPQS